MTQLVKGDLDSNNDITPAGCMAQAIDDALAALIPMHSVEDPKGRRSLAVAVAKGVISHLKANEQAFVVHVPDGGGGYYDAYLTIDVA